MHDYIWKRKLRTPVMILAMISLFNIIAGCTESSESDDERVQLKVLSLSEKGFYSTYGVPFMSRFPNVDIEVVTLPLFLEESPQQRKDKQIQFIESEQPDILLLSEQQFKDVSSENLLMELDTLLNQDKDKQFLSGMVPTVTDYIRSIGSGRLYGLSNRFYSQALYYNKDLFDRANIPYPRDGMNWEEVLQLAQLFNREGTESYGLMLTQASSPFQLAIQIGLSKSMRYVDGKGEKITISGEHWRHIFEMAVQSFQSKSIYESSDADQPQPGMTYNDILHLDPFLSGKTAMVISGSFLAEQIKDVQLLDHEKKLNWDMATIPSDGRTIDFSSFIWLEDVVTINSKAPNVKAAWEFVKYVNGDEYARISSAARLNNGGLTSRTSYLKDTEGHNYAAFYDLSITSGGPGWIERLPQGFHSAFNEAGERELTKVYEGQISIEQALQNLEDEGLQMLRK
ncbi:hypothetical protein B1748_10960 [Paenibacillus sp. MY03]|nr:hypothetical protein B1748_10960 [Paenibacillus sp. MY03]